MLFNEHNFPGVTILLSLTIFLNMVSAMMPVTDNNPLLGNSEILLRRKSINVTLKKNMKNNSAIALLLGENL